MRHVTLITTGGTIEKTYNERTGLLENSKSVVQRMLRRLRLEDTRVTIVELLSKDSLDITQAERELIAREVVHRVTTPMPAGEAMGIVILHGTDTLCQTGELLYRELSALSGRTPKVGEGPGAVVPPGAPVPVVLTGAMRPFEMVRSDALQNLTEAILATSAVPAGVYVAAHGRVLRFPGVVKNRERGTFERVGG